MLPVKKISRTRTRTRRSHHALKATNYTLCQQCGTAKLPHAACDNCGYVNKNTSLDLNKEDAK